MNSPCSDELLVRARRNSLSPLERTRLEIHLARCEACALELRWGRAFDRALGERTGDDLLAARIATDVIHRWAPGHRSRRPRRTRISWLAFAAALVAVAGVASAAFWDRLSVVSPARFFRVPRAAPSAADVGRAAPASDGRPIDATGPLAQTAPSPVDSEPATPAAPVARHRDARMSIDVEGTTPDQLFVRANDARHRGDLRAAVTLYRALERQYPDAREATLSRVLLGRILLMDEIGDPEGALTQLDAYLASAPDGALVEEALWARGRALDRLGRTSDARDAWRKLLARFPDSIYGAHARQRLGEP